MDRTQLDQDLKTLDQYDVDQKERETKTKSGIQDYDKKIAALKNLSGYKGINEEGIKKQIDSLETAKELDNDRLGDYSEVRENYNIDEPLTAEPEVDDSFDNVIRGLDKQINTLDENDAEFDKDYKKLMRRREALIKLNSDRK